MSQKAKAQRNAATRAFLFTDGSKAAQPNMSNAAASRKASRVTRLGGSSPIVGDCWDSRKTSDNVPRYPGGGPQLNDNRSLKKSKCTCEYTENHQLLCSNRDRPAPPGKICHQRNQNREVHPPWFGDKSNTHERYFTGDWVLKPRTEGDAGHVQY